MASCRSLSDATIDCTTHTSQYCIILHLQTYKRADPWTPIIESQKLLLSVDLKKGKKEGKNAPDKDLERALHDLIRAHVLVAGEQEPTQEHFGVVEWGCRPQDDTDSF